MTTIAPANSFRDGGVLPDDLSGYIGKKTLVKLILEAIETWNAGGTEAAGVAAGQAPFQPALLVTLLTYCYATGVYASADIELGMRQDSMIRYLCAKNDL